MKNDESIKFSQLSVPLKIAVILAWTTGIITCLAFAIGFMQGLMGY